MKLAIALVLLVLGTIAFHFWSPWWFTPLASDWGAIDTTVDITFWVTGFVFVTVNLFIAAAIFRFRHRKDRRAAYEPENKKLEVWLTIFTSVGVAAMLAPGLIVWADFVNPPEDAAQFEVLGQQWHWTFRFPGEDGEFGKVSAKFIDQQNPFGIDPKDLAGQDDVLVADNELHLPKDQPVKALLRSKDVLHNFTVPQFRSKMDLVPGLESFVWFTPTRTGTFDILCEEHCGLAHFSMRGKVVVEEEEDFLDWLATKPTFAQTMEMAAGDPQAGKPLFAVCTSCHGANGEGNRDLNAPRLAGMSEWYTRRQLHYYKDGIRGTNEADTFGQQMAPMAQVLTDDTAVNNVAAYIATLPAAEPAATIGGDAKRGHHYYVTCGACHGKEGQGNFSLNAPRLAGQHDWYLKQQIENFKTGVRGSHGKDRYGQQMVLMAKMLTNDQAIDDVLAYVNTLGGGEKAEQPLASAE